MSDRIHDPKLDHLFQGQGQRQQVAVAMPLDNGQLVSLMAAAIMGDRHKDAAQCVDDAIHLFAEVVAQSQSGNFQYYLEVAKKRIQAQQVQRPV